MRATRAYVYLDRLAHNVTYACQRATGAALCIAVKANAYGHGLVAVARFLERIATNIAVPLCCGVATVDEGAALRCAGITMPILLFSYVDESELRALYDYRLEPFVGDVDYCARLAQAAPSAAHPLRVHIKIDSGMGRLGCRAEELGALMAAVQRAAPLQPASLCTHLADSHDRTYTDRQDAYFTAACARLGGSAAALPRHAANSGALLNDSAPSYQMVRPGIMIYGYDSDPAISRAGVLQPVMELRSKVVVLRQIAAGESVSYGMTWRSDRRTTIAVVPVGYGDGYTRRLSGTDAACVLLQTSDGVGHRAPIVGRICMDQCMVDVGAVPAVRVGQEVILFGDAAGAIGADTLARATDTIAYEITSGIQDRVPRVYVEGGVETVAPPRLDLLAP